MNDASVGLCCFRSPPISQVAFAHCQSTLPVFVNTSGGGGGGGGKVSAVSQSALGTMCGYNTLDCMGSLPSARSFLKEPCRPSGI